MCLAETGIVVTVEEMAAASLRLIMAQVYHRIMRKLPWTTRSLQVIHNILRENCVTVQPVANGIIASHTTAITFSLQNQPAPLPGL